MKLHVTLSLAALAAFAAVGTASAVEVDGVAANVGSDTILKSEVFAEMRRRNASADDYADIRNDLIDRKLILKAARDAKITLPSWVVDKSVREFIDRSFGGDRNKLIQSLSKQKMSYTEWFSRHKDDMTIAAMRWNVIDKNIVPGPADLKKEYSENSKRYRVGGKVTVSVILLKPEDMSLRDKISVEIQKKSFAELAKKYSADSRAADGGMWKDVVPGDVFKEEICEEIQKMPKGTISRWIEIDGWSFLLRKESEIPGRQLGFIDAYDEIAANVKDAQAKRAYQEWIERLREETYIKVF